MPDFLKQLTPELLTLAAALILILADLIPGRGSRRWLGWFSSLLALAAYAGSSPSS